MNNTTDIVAKLWNLCHVLRADGTVDWVSDEELWKILGE